MLRYNLVSGPQTPAIVSQYYFCSVSITFLTGKVKSSLSVLHVMNAESVNQFTLGTQT